MATKLYGIDIGELAMKARQTGPPRIKDTVRKVRGIHKRAAHTNYLFPKREMHSGVPSKPEDRSKLRRKLPFFLRQFKLHKTENNTSTELAACVVVD